MTIYGHSMELLPCAHCTSAHQMAMGQPLFGLQPHLSASPGQLPTHIELFFLFLRLLGN